MQVGLQVLPELMAVHPDLRGRVSINGSHRAVQLIPVLKDPFGALAPPSPVPYGGGSNHNF